jgi:hypothetical protein
MPWQVLTGNVKGAKEHVKVHVILTLADKLIPSPLPDTQSVNHSMTSTKKY